MAHITLVTGGSRSGKSAYAQKLGESLPGPRAYLATCLVADPEMAERVDRHRQARQESAWETIEEPLDLAAAIRQVAACRVLLVDCLTLWSSNLLAAAAERGEPFTEEAMARSCEAVLRA